MVTQQSKNRNFVANGVVFAEPNEVDEIDADYLSYFCLISGWGCKIEKEACGRN